MKAITSVNDVIVMDTPACFNTSPILSGRGRFCSFTDNSSQHVIMTNISSTPGHQKAENNENTHINLSNYIVIVYYIIRVVRST